MKNFMILLAGILLLSSCHKNKDDDSIMSCTKGEQTFSDASGTVFTVAQQQWYLQRNDMNGGSFNLKFSGSTNADSATVRSYGDGLISDSKIELDTDKKFSKDLCISFSVTSRPSGELNCGTLILVYRNTQVLTVNLQSCTLRY